MVECPNCDGYGEIWDLGGTHSCDVCSGAKEITEVLAEELRQECELNIKRSFLVNLINGLPITELDVIMQLLNVSDRYEKYRETRT